MRNLRYEWVAVLVMTGCSSSETHSKEAPVPKYDANAIAQAAIAEFDKNKNGLIDGAEFNSCPALQSALL